MSPQNGADVSAKSVTVTISVTNFNIVDKQGQAAVAGEGHVHYYLDVQPPTTPGQPAVPPSGSIWATVAATSYTFTNLALGQHTIYVELVNNDHTPLVPPVTASVQINAVDTTSGGTGGTGGGTASGPIPPEVAQYASDWPLPQGSYESTRATFTASINSSNVNTLGVAWTTPLKGAISTNPIIMGNNIFLQDNAYNIWSIDFDSGNVNWYVENNKPWIGPAGVCVGWGKVFGSATSYDIAAWDMNTGKAVWDTPISNVNTNVHSNIQPIPYNNMIFTSTGPHVGGTQYGGADGYLWGIHQATGEIK